MPRDMVLKRFSCTEACGLVGKCRNLPMELVRFREGNPVDILFLTEFPGKHESAAKRYFDESSRHGTPFRNIIKRMDGIFGTNWSYAICGLSKAENNDPNKIDFKNVKKCASRILVKEVKYADPKVVVCFGEYAYQYIFGKMPPFGMMVEDKKLYKNVEFCGKKVDVFCSLHPSWHVRQADACGIGPLYEVIRRAIDYSLNGIDYSIPDKFETKLITDIDDVKDILNEARRTEELVCLDTEDENLNRVYGNELLSIQLSYDGKVGYTIPVNHYESPFKGSKKLKKIFNVFFSQPNPKTRGYLFVNAKYDMHQLYKWCNIIEYNAPLLDCSFAEYSLDENWTRLHGFPQGKGYYSLFTMAYKRGFNYYAESGTKELRANLSHLPLSKWVQYGGADVVAPWHIFHSQLLEAERTNYLDKFNMLNFVFFGHLIRACTYVEHCGLSIDVNVLNHLYSKAGPFDKAIKDVIDEFYKLDSVKRVNEQLVKAANGTSSSGLFGTSKLFNPSKNLHREALYFKEMKLEPVEDDEDDTGTTGKAFQKQYGETYKEVELLEQFNSLNKMKTGFVNPVYEWMNEKSPKRMEDFYVDQRVRGNFTYMAVTGRLRCYNPNCYTGDTRINVNGRSTTFEELAKKDDLKNNDDVSYNVDTPTGIRQAYKFWKYENQPVIQFTLDTGHTLKCTYGNDCYILNKNGIIQSIQAKDIKIGDYFLLTGSQSFPEDYKFDKKFIKEMKRLDNSITWPTQMTPELAYILGSLCADGSKLSFGQYEGNRRIFDYFQECWLQTFGFKNKHNEGWMTTANDNQTYFYHVYYQTKAMFKFFKYLGYDAKNLNSHNMIVPNSIFMSNKECIASFINAYIDSDGWFSTGCSRVNICSVSYDVITQISQLLLKFGIVGYIRKEVSTPKEYKGKQYKKVSYLDISGYMFDRFMYKIGFGKKTVQEPILSDPKNGGNLCRIPNIIPNISKNTEQSLLFRKSGAMSLNIRRINDRFMYKLQEENIKIYKSLKFIKDNEITPVRIKNIEEIGNETVYDFTIEKDESQIPPLRYGNIIVNGILQRQSQQRPAHGKYTKNILSMYTPPKGRALVKLDYVTFEVKGLGFVSEDKAMVKSFNEMHKLKDIYRNDPLIFFEQGKEIEEKNILDKENELKSRKKKIKNLKEESPKDYKEAVEKYKKDVEIFREEKEKFEIKCEEHPEKISHDYLSFQTDFHKRTASLFNNCKIEEVSKSARQAAKGICFGSIYGRSIQSIAQELKIELEIAQDYYNKFFGSMPQAGEWLEKQRTSGRNNLYVDSPIGRRRRVWGFLVGNKTIDSKMERLSMNSVIQGVCSDFNLIATSLLITLINDHNRLWYDIDKSKQWMLTNLVHDSCEMEVPVEDVYYVLKTFESLYTNLLMYYVKKAFKYEIKVPLEVDFTVGSSYANTEDWDGSDSHAKKLQKWILEECGKRDNEDYSGLYKKAIKHPFFEEFKGIDKEVVEKWIIQAKEKGKLK